MRSRIHVQALGLLVMALTLGFFVACTPDQKSATSASEPSAAAALTLAQAEEAEAAKLDPESEIEAERGKSKNPPIGAPWIREFSAAHAAAFASGKPIFVYSTKTY